MMTLAITGAAPDSHRGPVFLTGPDGQRGPAAMTCFFVGFLTYIVTSVRVSVASDGVLALVSLRPHGAPTISRGALSAPPPWLRP